MKRVILVLVAMFAIAAVASATSYKLDDAVVETLHQMIAFAILHDL